MRESQHRAARHATQQRRHVATSSERALSLCHGMREELATLKSVARSELAMCGRELEKLALETSIGAQQV